MATIDDGYRYGLSTFKFNDVELGCIDEDSVDWGGNDPEVVKIWAAQKRTGPVKLIKRNNGENELAFNLIELKATNLAQVMGGTAALGVYSAPSDVVNLEGSVEMTTSDGAVIEIPRVSLVAKPKGKFGYTDVFKIACKMTILAPAAGGAPFTITDAPSV